MNRILQPSCIYLFFMSKKKPQENTVKKSESVINIPYSETELEKKIAKYFWIIIPILTILYYSYRKISVGFYQDDEVAQYINMLNFWQDPWVILGNGPKPGYKIFMVIPALFSYDAVLIFNSFIASVTVYMTYVLIKTYNVRYAIYGALLLASQPLYVNLSFRSYSEIFTALCLVSFLILYKKKKFLFSALLLGYVYTIRQETALLIAVFAVIFIMRKEYTYAAALFAFPLLYDLLGFIKTGDAFFVLTEMKSVAGLNYKSQGLFHYFKVYIFIVGPVCLTLFLIGFFGFFNNLDRYKEYFKKYWIFYTVFVSVFIIQMLTMISDGPNPGNWRYLLHISPLCAFFAAVGLNNLGLDRFKNTGYIIITVFAVLTLLFLSKTTDGFVLQDQENYRMLGFVVFILALSFFLRQIFEKNFVLIFGVILVLLAVLNLYFVETKKLSPEIVAIKQAAEYIDQLPGAKDKEKLTNHTFVMFFSQSFRDNTTLFKKLDMKNLKDAPIGSLIIWDSHYGYRPEFANDVKSQVLLDTNRYKMLSSFNSSDDRFGSYIFEKH